MKILYTRQLFFWRETATQQRCQRLCIYKMPSEILFRQFITFISSE